MYELLDLFSGIGGFSLGLEKSGKFKTVAFCEKEAYPRAVIKKHWPKIPMFEDIRDLNKGVLDAFGIKPTAMCGGFPCQDISVAGKGAGLHGERSKLWFEYLRLIDEIKPNWVIIENVKRMQSKGLVTVMQGLDEVGYDAEWHIIAASHIGALHQRERVWILAYPKSANVSKSVISGSIQNHEWGWGVVPTIGSVHLRCNKDSAKKRKYLKPSNDFIIDGLSHGLVTKQLYHLGNAVHPGIVNFIGTQIVNYDKD